MPEAVGSTFGGGGLGGLVILVLYVVLGPGAVVFHSARWALNRWSVAYRGRAMLSPSQRETIRKCLPWNLGITLAPALPYVFAVFR
jgi:hypothetical protein